MWRDEGSPSVKCVARGPADSKSSSTTALTESNKGFPVTRQRSLKRGKIIHTKLYSF
jgi:hypothetical protein